MFLFKFFGSDFGNFDCSFGFWVMMVNLALFSISGDRVFRVYDFCLKPAKTSVFNKLLIFLGSILNGLLATIELLLEFSFDKRDGGFFWVKLLIREIFS
ncbi:unnamed protein product [Malus baccata var. baccata]